MGSDLETLDPASEVLTIAGRTFTQRALGLRGTAQFIEVLATTMAETGNYDVFNSLGDVDVSDTKKLDMEKILPIMIQTLRILPNALPRLIGICLRATSPDDEEFLADNVTPITALKVVKTFIVQNDIPQLVRDFTEVAAIFGKLNAAKTGSPVPVPAPVPAEASVS